ncbi:MAG TPA: Fic family protein [Gammaproteobacteria bacterium]|nr:Fic family protein [Gammaproteobacteria bacterium]
MRRQAGDYISASLTGLAYQAFVPRPLPPNPAVHWSPALLLLRDKANRALGRLDDVSLVLPDKQLFLYHYVRKEAVLSSQIEGTQSSLSDLLLFELDEAPGVPLDDVREVSNYVAALDHGLRRMRSGELPLSLRLLREMHAILLDGARGKNKSPGDFRRGQVWLGGPSPATARFVPPPPNKLMDCLDPFERFLHAQPDEAPVLEKAALAHVQFETIHPFMDGNGRLGRLLITLLLCSEEVLREPMLYLSLYFKQNRDGYYEALQRVRTHGDWEGWLQFFLQGVADTARLATDTARRLLELFDEDREKLQAFKRGAGSAIRVQQYLQAHPIAAATDMAYALDLSPPAVRSALARLEEVSIVREVTGRARYKLFAYDQYLQILAEGTEPLPR